MVGDVTVDLTILFPMTSLLIRLILLVVFIATKNFHKRETERDYGNSQLDHAPGKVMKCSRDT